MGVPPFTLSDTEEDFLINTDTDLQHQQLEKSVVFEICCRKMGMFELNDVWFGVVTTWMTDRQKSRLDNYCSCCYLTCYMYMWCTESRVLEQIVNQLKLQSHSVNTGGQSSVQSMRYMEDKANVITERIFAHNSQ